MKMPRNKFRAMAGKAPMEPDADDQKPTPKAKKGPKRSLFGKKGGASGGETY